MSSAIEMLKLFEDKIEDTCRHGDFDEVSYRACFEHLKERLKELDLIK